MIDDIEKYSRHAVLALIPGLFLVLAVPIAAFAQEVDPAQDGQVPAPAPLDDFSDLAEADDKAGAPSDDEAEELAPEILEVLKSMDEVIGALDENSERQGNNWQLTVDERVLLVVTDTKARRMRVLTPIAAANALSAEVLMRLMQANFDTALDARYAVAQNLVWGTFIHPLDDLTQREFASGVLQTKALADSFGTTFSSGVLNYGGGDSAAIIDQQVKELLEELEKNSTI